MRRNDEAIDRANLDLENADRHNPRNQRSSIRPCNLDADFILDYNGQGVYATPSANLTAVFQVLEDLQETPVIVKTPRPTAPSRATTRHDPMAMMERSTRTTSISSSTNKTCVSASTTIAERERRRQYDKEHGVPDANH